MLMGYNQWLEHRDEDDVQATDASAVVISDGDTITIDGSTGAVYVSVPTIEPR